MLKAWIEGATYYSSNVGNRVDGLGYNPYTNESIIHVDPIPVVDFKKLTFEQLKEYDTIVIGFMDINGGVEAVPSAEMLQYLSEYIDLGNGV
ncbi:hypothetical protein GPJ56_004210 [Histomonas meleagridis]|uniref:uncharacterized protein n=1 Tax=Histomonas meleagridis TaxID=135588 RepID=UPI00355939EA|nr:hypothetical protein GPJ56_004210 [Histomonas meleagridis]KAH0802241.1 hypothetical protein GO595_004854 [Histomonas meleagridis]